MVRYLRDDQRVLRMKNVPQDFQYGLLSNEIIQILSLTPTALRMFNWTETFW